MFGKCNDKWGQDVKLRLAGIPNDIIVSCYRYHKDCKKDFFLSFDKNGKSQSEKVYDLISPLIVLI